MSTNPHAANREANHIETPISALPSRFMNNELLPSPSAFYPADWGSNMLPSPFTFQTPVAGNGPSWRNEDDRKRANEDQEQDEGEAKRKKT
jgi:MADS-box transcription factor